MDDLSNRIDLEFPFKLDDEILRKEVIECPTLHSFFVKYCAGNKMTLEIFISSVRCLMTSESSEISLHYWLYFLKSGGGYGTHSDSENNAQHETIIGGTQQISNLMAQKLKEETKTIFHMNSVVYNIFQTNHKADVYYFRKGFSGENYSYRITGKYVIVTSPPPLAFRIHYEPPLSSARQALCQHMKMGSVIKCFIIYKTPFWRNRDLSGEIFTDKDPVCNYYDASPHDLRVGALIGFIAGKDALNWTEKTTEERKNAILEQLISILGPEASNPLGYIEKNWLEEPFICGAYQAVFPPNILHLAGHTLRKPHGRIHWAGSETGRIWIGYMEGALESAERVTDEIIFALNKSKL